MRAFVVGVGLFLLASCVPPQAVAPYEIAEIRHDGGRGELVVCAPTTDWDEATLQALCGPPAQTVSLRNAPDVECGVYATRAYLHTAREIVVCLSRESVIPARPPRMEMSATGATRVVTRPPQIVRTPVRKVVAIFALRPE